MILKGYFDGGNEADSTQYETVTLGALFGRKNEWELFDHAWNATLRKHGAPHLHTTDAVTFKNDFQTGWTEASRDAFIGDCARIIRDSIVKPEGQNSVKPGIFPCSITIVLKDFKRVQSEIPDGPQDATEVLAVQAFYRMIECSQWIEAHFLQFYFDRNEPFRGHLQDRLRNRKFTTHIKEQGFDLERRVELMGECNMRVVPALQAADLVAWCAGRESTATFSWQREMLEMPRIREWLDYAELSKPLLEVSRLAKERWRFPRRRPTR